MENEIVRLKAEIERLREEISETPGGGRENSPVRGASNPDSKAPIAKVEGKMSDIIERLADHEWVPLVKEAKAEIERLTALTEWYDKLDLERIAEIERLTAERNDLYRRLSKYPVEMKHLHETRRLEEK